MLELTLKEQIPSVETTISILSAYNQLVPICLDADKAEFYMQQYAYVAQQIQKPLFEIIRCPGGNPKNFMQNFLVEMSTKGLCDLSTFDKTKSGISLSKESIEKALSSGNISDDIALVIRKYQEFTSYKKLTNDIAGYLFKYSAPAPNLYTKEGHRINLMLPSWAPQETGRVAMRDPAIQNMSNILNDIITTPDGWIKVHCDSGQIDPRVAFSWFIHDDQIKTLINLYDDAYFGLYHYVTMPAEYITTHKMDFEKLEITDSMKEGRKSIKRMLNAVMYGSESNPDKDPIKAAMIERVGHHPDRLDRVEEIKNRIKHNETVVKTAFGTKLSTGNSKKLDAFVFNNDSYESELIKLGINYPIQGTSADLMRYSVSVANDIITKETPNSFIIMYVHDAGFFAIDEDKYDVVIDKFKDVVAYQVEDWIPIHSECEIGRENMVVPDPY